MCRVRICAWSYRNAVISDPGVCHVPGYAALDVAHPQNLHPSRLRENKYIAGQWLTQHFRQAWSSVQQCLKILSPSLIGQIDVNGNSTIALNCSLFATRLCSAHVTGLAIKSKLKEEDDRRTRGNRDLAVTGSACFIGMKLKGVEFGLRPSSSSSESVTERSR